MDIGDVAGATTVGPFVVLDCHNFTLNAGRQLDVNPATLSARFSGAWIRATGAVVILGTIMGDGLGPDGGNSTPGNTARVQSGNGYGGAVAAAGGGGAHARGGHTSGGSNGGYATPGFDAVFATGEAERLTMGGGGGGRSNTGGGGAAGATIAISGRTVRIGPNGQLTSMGAMGVGGGGSGGPIGILCDQFQNERVSDYIVNDGAPTSNFGGTGSEGHRELYYRRANPAIVPADWTLVRRWRAARREWTVPSN